jgi:hypothetical protein
MPIFLRGTMLVPGADVDNLGEGAEIATVLSATDGSVIGTLPDLATAETGDNLPSGRFALTAQVSPGVDVASISVFDPDDTLVAAIPVAPLTPVAWPEWHEFSPIRSNGLDTFYVLGLPRINTELPILYTVSDGGVLGGTTWTLPASANGGACAMAPARDDSKIYFGLRFSGKTRSNGIGRFSLSGAGSELTELIPTSAGLVIGRDLLVTAAGHVLVPATPIAESAWSIGRYQDDGTLLSTYALFPGEDPIFSDEIELAYDPSDDTVFWTRTYPSDYESRWTQYRLSDGAQLVTFKVPTIASAGEGATLIPTSCPFLIAPDSDPEPEPETCITAPVKAACWGDHDPNVTVVPPWGGD